MTLLDLIPYSFIIGFIGLMMAISIYFLVKSYPKGNEVMQEIAEAIHSGAMVFLRREYLFIAIFVAVLFIVLWRLFSIFT